jgi:hypothetical protein
MRRFSDVTKFYLNTVSLASNDAILLNCSLFLMNFVFLQQSIQGDSVRMRQRRPQGVQGMSNHLTNLKG